MRFQGVGNLIDNDGFTLVESLVAAGLIGLAFLAIINLFPTAYGNITYGGRVTTAVAYAQQKIERLKAIAADTTPGQGFSAINTTNCSTTPEILADPLVSSITFTRTCAVFLNVGVVTTPPPSLEPDLKKVRVTLTWADQYRPESIQMETLFTR